jgi:hypothetical protein
MGILSSLRRLFHRPRSPVVETHADVVAATNELLEAVEAIHSRLKDLELENVRISDALLPLEEARHQTAEDIAALQKDLNKIELDMCPEQSISPLTYLGKEERGSWLRAQQQNDYIEVPTGEVDMWNTPIMMKAPRSHR